MTTSTQFKSAIRLIWFVTAMLPFLWIAGASAASQAQILEKTTPLWRLEGDWQVFLPSLKVTPEADGFAMVTKKEADFAVIQAHRTSGLYDAIGKGTPVFSPDGRRMGFTARKNGKWHVVVDGAQGPGFDTVGIPQFSPDSGQYLYVAQKDGSQYLVVDTSPGMPCQGIITKFTSPCFSPDSSHTAYVTYDEGKFTMVVDGRKGPAFDAVNPPVFSPDSARLAYTAQRGKAYVMVENHRPGPEFDQIGMFAFSPDSSRLAYAARTGDKWVMVEGETPGPEFDRVAMPIFPRTPPHWPILAFPERHGPWSSTGKKDRHSMRSGCCSSHRIPEAIITAPERAINGSWFPPTAPVRAMTRSAFQASVKTVPGQPIWSWIRERPGW